jgi:hypothetical protein
MTAFFPAGFRLTDDDNNPLAGGSLRYYGAGTTTPKAVYADAALGVSLGSIVNLNASGEPVTGGNVQVIVYPGTGAYRVRLYDANGVLIWDQDGIPGAVEEEEESTSGLPITPVISKSDAYTVTVDDRGKLINANPTGGRFAITLPSAVTMGDNFRIGVRHNGSANEVAVVSSGSQFVRAHKVLRSYSLTGMGETAWFVSDGSDWIVDGYHPPFMKATAPYFRVLDRLTAPPANPAGGARYIINGTPTGAWSTLGFAENDIAEADGNGSWVRLTPETGWMAFDVDEEVTLQFKGGAWENFQIDPGTSTLKSFIVQDQKSSGTAGGTAVTSAWTTAVLNTSLSNSITGSSLASNKITLPAGTYEVEAFKTFYMTRDSRIRFKTADDDSIIIYGPQAYLGEFSSNSDQRTESGGILSLKSRFTIATTTDFILQYLVVGTPSDGSATHGLGAPMSSGTAEVYATVAILDLASLQGPKGDQGDQGGDGEPSALFYQFNTATSGDPGPGKLLINNASPVSATVLHISETDANTADLSALVSIFDDSTSVKKAIVLVTKVGEPNNVMAFRITGTGTDQGDYWTFPVEYVAHDGSFDNNDDTGLVVIPIGEKGDTGASGPTGSTAFDFDDGTTDTDPGAGALALNHASPASATEAYIDDANNGGEDVSDWLDTFDDSGNSTLRGYLHIFDAVSPTTVFAIYAVSGAVTDGTGYRKVTIAYVTGAGSFSDGNELLVAFFARGPAGAGLADVVEDLTPQLGGHLDANGQNIDFDDNTGIRDDSGNEHLIFRKTASAVNHVEMTNAAAGNHPLVAAVGDSTDINLDLAAKGTGKVRVSGSPALKASGAETLTGGFAATAIDLGTITTGTVTPVLTTGNFYKWINGGAHALAVPPGEGTAVAQVTNNGSAGAITTSSYTRVTGDTITTTNGHDFFFFITVINGFSHLHVQALQ